LKKFLPSEKLFCLKTIVSNWLRARLSTAANPDLEASLIFYFTDTSLLRLGLHGTSLDNKFGRFGHQRAFGANAVVELEALLSLDRGNIRSLTKQIADETSTTFMYDRDESGDHISDFSAQALAVDSASSLQSTLKLAYLFLDFSRQLLIARELIAITIDPHAPQHHLDQSVLELRRAEDHVSWTKSAMERLSKVDSNNASGKIRCRGIHSRIQFMSLVPPEDFTDFIRCATNKSLVDTAILDIYSVLHAGVCSVLRMLREYSLYESFQGLHNQSLTQSDSKPFESVCLDLYRVMETLTLNDILDYLNVEELGILSGISTALVEWQSIPDFFSSPQMPPSNLVADQLHIPLYQLRVAQIMGSMLVHISGLLQRRDFYIQNDVQVKHYVALK